MDLGAALLGGGESALNNLLGVSTGAAQTAAGSTPALSGAAQSQAPATGQGVVAATPVNYLPWVIGGAVLLTVILLVATKK